MTKKEYSNGEITIVWKPKLCMHSGYCSNLNSVFKSKEKPWIQPEGATTEEIRAQVKKCPSGALTYYMNDGSDDQTDQMADDQMQIKALFNGPFLISGPVKIKMPDGSIQEHSGNTSLCRCGESSNKPYCDGTHNKIKFQG